MKCPGFRVFFPEGLHLPGVHCEKIALPEHGEFS